MVTVKYKFFFLNSYSIHWTHIHWWENTQPFWKFLLASYVATLIWDIFCQVYIWLVYHPMTWYVICHLSFWQEVAEVSKLFLSDQIRFIVRLNSPGQALGIQWQPLSHLNINHSKTWIFLKQGQFVTLFEIVGRA